MKYQIFVYCEECDEHLVLAESNSLVFILDCWGYIRIARATNNVSYPNEIQARTKVNGTWVEGLQQ